MKIQILSDLHLEGQTPKFLKDFKSTGDVLVLAGDITNFRNRGQLDQFGRLGIPVLYVLGNHEYYGSPYDYTEVVKEYKQWVQPFPSIKLLDNDAWSYEGISFIGSTYWSNPKVLDEPLIASRISDFISYYNKTTQESVKVIPGRTVENHRQDHYFAKRFIESAVKHSKERGLKTVVVTHFPPSWQAQEERFKSVNGVSDAFGSYFYNNDDDFVSELSPDLWIYGHTHGNIRFKIGDVPVEVNQYGYSGEVELKKSFSPDYCVEV